MTSLPSRTPIAIVGMAVRAPGVSTISEFWRRLLAGDRFYSSTVENQPGGTRIRFDNDVEEQNAFDADFFGSNNVEAELTDPQQRKLLEMAWEAFEDACIDVRRGPRDVGVFVASSFSEYYLELVARGRLGSDPALSMMAGFGCHQEHAATRLAYTTPSRQSSRADARWRWQAG
jgi:phthiocerol/phenolphthiocerol synthesis type-I polyketide synthase E